jgi:hypothetical protein
MPVSLDDVTGEWDIVPGDCPIYLNRKTGEVFAATDEEEGMLEDDAEDDSIPDWQKVPESLFRLHHRLDLPGADEKAVWLARQLAKIPLTVEIPGGIVDAIENDSDKCEGSPGLVTIPQRLSQQQAAESLTLVRSGDSEPGQDGHRQHATGKSLADLGRQVAKIHLSCCQCVRPGDAIALVQQHTGHRKVFFLVLKGFGAEPVVDLVLAAVELSARVITPEPLETKPGRQLHGIHDPPRIREPRRR